MCLTSKRILIYGNEVAVRQQTKGCGTHAAWIVAKDKWSSQHAPEGKVCSLLYVCEPSHHTPFLSSDILAGLAILKGRANIGSPINIMKPRIMACKACIR